MSQDTTPRNYPGLRNVVTFHDGYYSGSEPAGDAGFDVVAGMGVKTIISVDGAVPDVAAAKARGIRYIHLPIGYNGFGEARKLELVRATRDAMRNGAVYVHCHHGKHRSAGAAAAVATSLGWLDSDAAVARMKVSGTASAYVGLYACARCTVLSAAAVDAVSPDFPEVWTPNGFVATMVEIDEINERLKLIEHAEWKTPADHPDLVPVAEAGRMADLLRFLADDPRARSKPAQFGHMLRECGDQAQGLEDLLAGEASDSRALSEQMKRVAIRCKGCHASYRDK